MALQGRRHARHLDTRLRTVPVPEALHLMTNWIHPKTNGTSGTCFLSARPRGRKALGEIVSTRHEPLRLLAEMLRERRPPSVDRAFGQPGRGVGVTLQPEDPGDAEQHRAAVIGAVDELELFRPGYPDALTGLLGQEPGGPAGRTVAVVDPVQVTQRGLGAVEVGQHLAAEADRLRGRAVLAERVVED